MKYDVISFILRSYGSGLFRRMLKNQPAGKRNMLEYIVGDIFDSPAQVIVNTVNTVGVMGKGLALSFKHRYPEMFNAYRKVCEKKQLEIGKLMLYYAPDHWILLFPTKENWRNPSKLEYLEKGLKKFVGTYADKGITSIAFPRLGCGNGELNWEDVRPLMEKYLKPLPIDVYIYLGMDEGAVPEHRTPSETLGWMKTNARDMSFNGIKDEIRCNSRIVPHSFTHGGSPMNAQWADNNLIISAPNGSAPLVVSEDEFFEIWDDVRTKGVFPDLKEKQKATLIFALLHSLGYLSKIGMSDGRSPGKEVAGYQVREGAGRAYAFKEV